MIPKEEAMKLLAEAHRNGETIKALSKRCGVTYNTLGKYAHEMGLKFPWGLKARPGYQHSPETRKKISKSTKGKRKLSYDERIDLINDYMGDQSQSWAQLAKRYHTTEKQVKTIIGEHLLKACRADDKCPYKPLLPEYKPN